MIATYLRVYDWHIAVALFLSFIGWFLYLMEMRHTDKLEQEIKELKKHIQKIWKYSREIQ